MESIHCLECGGYITHPRRVEYRTRAARPIAAPKRAAQCRCSKPFLYMPVFHAAARRELAVHDAPTTGY